MRLSATIGAAIALAACDAGLEKPFMWTTLDGKPPLVIAHRGASGYRPEHTLEAYALAVEMGADVIEPDLVFTKDGVLVARHDRYLSTTTNIADHPELAGRKRPNDDPDDTPREDWWVEDFTLAELKTLRARQPFPGRSKEFDGLYEIPTFEEMLALVARKAKEAGRPVGVYAETKHPAFYLAKGFDFEAPLLTALDQFNAGPVFIQSFEPEILKRLKGKPNAKLVQLVYEKEPGAGPNIALEEIANYADGVGAAKSLEFTKSIDFRYKAAALGLFVHYWTFRIDTQNHELIASLSHLDKMKTNTSQNLLCNRLLVSAQETDLCVGNKFRPYRQELANDPSFELKYYLGAGADGVFTDFPDTAVAVRAGMNAERPTRK